jgi:hypothetical protein
VHADDVVVRQRRERARLAREPPPLIRLGRDERTQQLDRDLAFESYARQTTPIPPSPTCSTSS